MAAVGKLVSTVAKSEQVSAYMEKARARLDDLSPYRTGTEGRDRVLAGKPIFSDPVFWRALPSKPRHIDGVLRAWYPTLERDDAVLRSTRRKLGSAYVPLLLDPGIACRVEEFLPFAADWQRSNKGGSPFQLRAAFARSLGNGQVYRAISAHRDDVFDFGSWTPDTRVDVARNWGMRQTPSLRKDAPSPVAALDALFEGMMRPRTGVGYPGVARLMDQHARGGSGARSLLTSYTRYPEVALSVTGSKGQHWQTPVLLTARIPEISLVQTTGLLRGHGVSNGRGRLLLASKPSGSPSYAVPEIRMNLDMQDPKIEVFTFLQKSGVTESVDVRGQGGSASKLLDSEWSFLTG